LFNFNSGSTATPPVTPEEEQMTTKKQLGSCIDSLKLVLGDANNELSSEQRRNLELWIRNLKKLQKAKKFTHEEVFVVVNEIAKAVLDILKIGSGK
jgi:hypothetical protein